MDAALEDYYDFVGSFAGIPGEQGPEDRRPSVNSPRGSFGTYPLSWAGEQLDRVAEQLERERFEAELLSDPDALEAAEESYYNADRYPAIPAPVPSQSPEWGGPADVSSQFAFSAPGTAISEADVKHVLPRLLDSLVESGRITRKEADAELARWRPCANPFCNEWHNRKGRATVCSEYCRNQLKEQRKRKQDTGTILPCSYFGYKTDSLEARYVRMEIPMDGEYQEEGGTDDEKVVNSLLDMFAHGTDRRDIKRALRTHAYGLIVSYDDQGYAIGCRPLRSGRPPIENASIFMIIGRSRRGIISDGRSVRVIGTGSWRRRPR
ncbi:hypothetical protein [Paludifilum halophilum]|nr:hypothetical protein [Paludifilum halophilum]